VVKRLFRQTALGPVTKVIGMNDSQSTQIREKKWPRIVLFIAIGLVAFSSAIKELSQAQAFLCDAAEFVSRWSDAVVPTANARTRIKRVRVEKVVVNEFVQDSQQSGEFRWNGAVAPGQSIEIKGINGDIKADATSGNEVQVLATKKSRRSDVNQVQIKVVQHAAGVTICALYPTESGETNDCGPDDGQSRNKSGNTKNNDVTVDFTVRVPARVGFIGRTINGEVSATALSGNVVAKTINGSIRISTTGYAEASTINGEISAKFGDANWPAALNFKTLNGEINLDLPANVSTEVDAETLNGQINSDFPINLVSYKNRKHLRGRIGVGGRELHLKTLNGSINLRLAS
jgi:Putative adhesin